MAESRLESKIGATLVLRCAAFGIVMAFANIVPYLLTRGAYETGGIEVAGWPFRCHKLGGEDPVVDLHPWALAGNIAFAVTVSAAAAWAFRHGVLRTLRRWQNWGTRTFRRFRIWGTPYAK